MEMNIFTLLALKSKRIEPLSSAWWHFEDFFLLFLMVIDFNVFFIVVWSQIRHKGETIFLSKMVQTRELRNLEIVFGRAKTHRLILENACLRHNSGFPCPNPGYQG